MATCDLTCAAKKKKRKGSARNRKKKENTGRSVIAHSVRLLGASKLAPKRVREAAAPNRMALVPNRQVPP